MNQGDKMKRNTAQKILTFAQKIIVLKAASVMLMSQMGMAQVTIPAQTEAVVKAQAEVDKLKQDRQICIDKQKEYNTAQQEFSTACSQSGIGGSCGSRISKCNDYWGKLDEEDVSAEEEKANNELFKMLGVSLDPGEEDRPEVNSLPFTCAKTNEADWKAEEEKISKELEDLKEDITDLQKDTVKERAEIEKEIGELKKEKSDREKEYNDAIKTLSDDVKKQKKSIEENIESMKADYRKKDADYLKIQNSIGKLMSEKASAISQSFRICEQQLLQMKGQIAQAKSKSKPAIRSGMKSLTRGSSYEKQQLAKAYKSCMAEAQQQRKNATIEYNSRIAEAQNNLVAMQEEMVVAREKMQQASQEIGNLLSEQTTQMSQTQQDALKNLSRINEAISQKESEKSQHQQIVQKRLNEINEKISERNKVLARLGKRPAGATKTMADAQAAYQKRLSLAGSFYESSCCPKGTGDEFTGEFASLCKTTKSTYESHSAGASKSSGSSSTGTK